MKTQKRSRRILVVSSIDISLIRFRGKLITEFIKRGYEVVVAAPHFSPKYEAALRELGTLPIQVDLKPNGMSPMEDLRTVLQLYRLMKNENIDLAFPYTMKPVIYTSLAGRLANIPTVGMISGLGYLFTGDSLKRQVLRNMVTRLIRYCIRSNKAMVFQNEDDACVFRENKLVAKDCKVAVVSGSGVDLEEFCWRSPRRDNENPKFVFFGRLLVDKGVLLFMNAAKEIKQQWPRAEFHMYGDIPPDTPNATNLQTIEGFCEAGFIQYHGHCENVPEMLKSMDVMVFPSWYREGVPRAILEALSVGLPVITTDSPGCRETVVHGRNGWKIQPKSQAALNTAIANAIENPDNVVSMSFESHKLAMERFDVTKVNADLLDLLLPIAEAT